MKIYKNKDFADMSFERIRDFVEQNKRALVGSAVFTRNKSAISKLICFVSKGREPDSVFVPSHTGSIIAIRGEIYCFDMKPSEGKITLLSEYLATTQDDFIIIAPDFRLNDTKFSQFVARRIGQKYGTSSAIKSAFRIFSKTSKKEIEKAQNEAEKERKEGEEHCSEIHMKALQAQGLFLEYNATDLMPVDVIRILTTKEVITDEQT